MVSVCKRFLIAASVLMVVYSFIILEGCAEKKYNEMHARVSEEWVHDAIIYEANLRSLSNEGLFKTLEVRIPKLKKLGFTVISLIPIFPIGELNRKGKLGSLDAARDFYTVSSEFGTLEDFKSLINTIHQQGLKIIVNLVASQATWDSQLLMEHPDWFVHNEEGTIISPNSDRDDVAQIDYHQHELRKYMIAMMKYWIQEIGIDGFQCRNAEMIPTDFWNVARCELDKIKPVLMISESRLPEHHIKAFDLTCSWDINNTLASIINGNAPASIINDSLNGEFQQYPKGSLHLLFNKSLNENTEDVSDIEKSNSQIAKLSTVLAFTLPGVPFIYADGEDGNKKQLNYSNKFYEDLITLRQNYPALLYGSYSNVQNSVNSNLFSFIRSSGKDSILVVVNFANEKKEADIQLSADASLFWKDQFSGISFKVKNSSLRIDIASFGIQVLLPSSEREIK